MPNASLLRKSRAALNAEARSLGLNPDEYSNKQSLAEAIEGISPQEVASLIINHRYDLVDGETLTPHPKNPREGDIGAIYESIKSNGFYGALVAQVSTRFILAGNHRYEAGRQAGIGMFPVFWVDVDDATALRILLADNRTNDLASYDFAQLVEVLESIQDQAGTLEGTGYDGDDLDQLLQDLDREDDGDDRNAEGRDGALLAIADVTVGEPKHEVSPGDVWKLGPHTLVVCDVQHDWARWAPLLVDDAVFVPFPGFYAPLIELADRRPFVMVQPDTYIAGHILDKYAAVKGKKEVKKASAQA